MRQMKVAERAPLRYAGALIRGGYSPPADTYAAGRSVRYSVVDRKRIPRSSQARSFTKFA